jgi:hypothetical protein
MVGAGEVEERPPWLAVGWQSQLASAFGWAPADSVVAAGQVGASRPGGSGRLNR